MHCKVAHESGRSIVSATRSAVRRTPPSAAANNTSPRDAATHGDGDSLWVVRDAARHAHHGFGVGLAPSIPGSRTYERPKELRARRRGSRKLRWPCRGRSIVLPTHLAAGSTPCCKHRTPGSDRAEPVICVELLGRRAAVCDDWHAPPGRECAPSRGDRPQPRPIWCGSIERGRLRRPDVELGLIRRPVARGPRGGRVVHAVATTPDILPACGRHRPAAVCPRP